MKGSNEVHERGGTYGSIKSHAKDHDHVEVGVNGESAFFASAENLANGRMKQNRSKQRPFLDRFFKLTERNTTVAKEVRAGTATFLTMAYILLVNPEILGKPHTGLEKETVVIATALASSLASLVVGVGGNLPFGLAPGLGLGAYLSYGLVEGSGLPWEGALVSCLVTGLIMFVLAVTNISDLLMSLIPKTIKLATVVGMGLLLTFIGMQTINLVVAADTSLVKLGSLGDWRIWLSLGGLMLLATLTYHQIKGAILIGIFTVTLVLWFVNNSWPTSFVSLPIPDQFTEVFEAALSFNLLNRKYIPGILAFLAVGVFDVSGVMFGCARLADLHDDDGNIPGSRWAFGAAAVGTIVAAVLGCSPIIIHIESVAGIKEGGRTGLTAVTISCWFALSLFFAPLLGDVPVYATAPVLMLIGSMMMGQASEINWKSMSEAVPGFLTLAVMPLTFSIPNGILFGTVSHIILYCTTGGLFKWISEKMTARTMIRDGSFAEATTLVSKPNEVNAKTDPTRSPWQQGERYERTPSLLLRQEEYDQSYDH